MNIEVIEEKKLVCIWLTRAESSNEQLNESLKQLYKKCKEKGFFVAVYRSGTEDLLESTSALLIYNIRRSEELRREQEMGINNPVEKRVARIIATEHSLAAQRRKVRERIRKECGGWSNEKVSKHSENLENRAN